MDIQKRQKLIQYGKKMVENNLTFSTGGNLSIRIDDRSFLITPSGMAYESLKERDLVVTTSEGEILKGDRKPSSAGDQRPDPYPFALCKRSVLTGRRVAAH